MKHRTLIRICQALIISYLVTAFFVLVYALAVWKLDISKTILKGAVIFLYIISAAIFINKKIGWNDGCLGLMS